MDVNIEAIRNLSADLYNEGAEHNFTAEMCGDDLVSYAYANALYDAAVALLDAANGLKVFAVVRCENGDIFPGYLDEQDRAEYDEAPYYGATVQRVSAGAFQDLIGRKPGEEDLHPEVFDGKVEIG
jgi:hypothetical protein